MRTLPRRCLLLFAATLASMGTAARAAEDPLLVVVESPPGSGLDPAEVRRSVERELLRKVLAPTDTAASRSSQVLLVAFDGRQLSVSLRTGDVAPPPRTIPAPRGPAADLRAIAWLAGNLARDQVGPLLAAAVPASSPEPVPAPASRSLAAALEPPPPPAPSPAPVSTAAPDGSVRKGDVATSGEASRWTVTAAGGPTVTLGGLTANEPPGFATPLYGTTYRIEVQRQAAPDTLIFGAALEGGPDGDRPGAAHYLGIAALVGTRWLRPRWYLEATAGLGVEIMPLNTITSTTSLSATGGVTMSVMSSGQTRPALYARGVGAVGVPLNRSFDLIASLGLHLTSQGLETGFANASVGLRLRIP